MPYLQRPDLLPLALPEHFGLPLHGVVRDGSLLLPNTETVTYPQPEGGDITYVEHPLAVAAVRTTEEQSLDTALGHQWLTYAYLSGKDRQIGGQSLPYSAFTIRSWLYCTEVGTWLISAELSNSGSTKTITCTKQVFGVFGDKNDADAELLSEESWTYLNLSDAAATSTISIYNATHSKDGATTVINFRDSSRSELTINDYFCCAIQIDLSGDDTDGNPITVSQSVLCNGSAVLSSSTTIDQVQTITGLRTLNNTGGDYYVEAVLGSMDYCVQTYPPCPGDGKYGVEATVGWHWVLNVPATGYNYNKSDSIYIAGYYVLPAGTVDNVTVSLTAGSQYDAEVALSGGPNQQAYKDITYCTPPSTITGYEYVSSRDYDPVYCSHRFDENTLVGLVATVSVGDTDINAGRYYETVEYDDVQSWIAASVDDHPTGCLYEAGYPDERYPSDPLSTIVDSSDVTTYYIAGLETTSFTPSTDKDQQIKTRWHNNNVIDIYERNLGGGADTYLFSITIFGTRFSRNDGGLVNAVVDPRTGDVTLASAGQDISIV